MTDFAIRFQYSGCGKRLRAQEAAAGRTVKCSGCGFAVQVPSVATSGMNGMDLNMSPQQQRIPQSSTATPAFDVGSDTASPAQEKATSSFALWRWIDNVFDFRFRRYLTPYIIRAFWILALIGVTVFLIYSTLIAPFAEKPDLDSLRSTAKQTTPAAKPSELSKSFSEIANWIVMSVLKTIGCILLLMFIRVAAELAIVIFNISKDLKRLEPMQQSTE